MLHVVEDGLGPALRKALFKAEHVRPVGFRFAYVADHLVERLEPVLEPLDQQVGPVDLAFVLYLRL